MVLQRLSAIFDLSVNDFDEAHPGPWKWDLKRLVASFLVAARDLRHGQSVEETVCHELVKAYQQTMLECAEQSALETWYGSAAYARLCGQALARTHAKSSGNAAYISGYIGKSEALADALYTYAHGYAKQTERDFEQFQQACRKGRLQARSETNFAADHLP
ncbi:hypothetical protein D3C76_759360 [compost metagenome]